MSEVETINGIVERITYYDEDKGYGVIKVRVKGFSELITFTGKFVSINVGTMIEAKGNFTINKKFGRQFSVVGYKESLPASINGIEKYLGSGLIEGIDPKFAKQIVKEFGENTINIIENNPMNLLDIPKIGLKRVQAIKDSWEKHRNIKDLMIFLSGCGILATVAHKIYKVYGEESIIKLKENSYSIVDDIYGLGFKTADMIAEKLGLSKESYNRCRTGIFHILNEFSREGNCYASLDDLIKKGEELLDISEEIVVMTFDYLKDHKELICEDVNNIIYLPPFYHSEVGISKRIYEISTCKSAIDNIDLKTTLNEIQKRNQITYDETQISSIKTAVNSKFSVITGGPGVGKTTITKAIIDIFKSLNKRIILAAPTGRAAKRMTETCKVEAKTIHRLLEGDHTGKFNKNEENKYAWRIWKICD